MPLLAFGINHKTAPIAIRERVAFAPPQISDALRQLTTLPAVQEAAILSTCNRTEIVCCVEEDHSQSVIDWFQHYHKLQGDGSVLISTFTPINSRYAICCGSPPASTP